MIIALNQQIEPHPLQLAPNVRGMDGESGGAGNGVLLAVLQMQKR